MKRRLDDSEDSSRSEEAMVDDETVESSVDESQICVEDRRKKKKSALDAPDAAAKFELETQLVMAKLIEYLMLNQQALPTSKADLLGLIAKCCSATFTVDVKVVFYHLLLNGVIVLTDSDSTIKANPNYDQNRPLLGFLPIRDGLQNQEQFAGDFKRTLTRCIEWVRNSVFLPTDQAFFLQSLKKHCTFTRTAPSSLVVQRLLHNNYIQLAEDADTIVYHLPAAHPATEEYGHYMSSCIFKGLQSINAQC
jgi:hypothetical protein